MTSFGVPLLLGIKGRAFRVAAGPLITFRVNDGQGLNNAWAKAYYGYQLGVGLNWGSFGIDVRHEGSLSDIAATTLSPAGSEQASIFLLYFKDNF